MRNLPSWAAVAIALFVPLGAASAAYVASGATTKADLTSAQVAIDKLEGRLEGLDSRQRTIERDVAAILAILRGLSPL